MCSQPFANFLLRLASLCLVPLMASTELTGHESIRTDRYGDPLPKGAIMRLGTLRFCQPIPWCLAFSPDGKFLASGGADKRIRLWDPDTGKEFRALEGHKGHVSSLAITADGKWLASGSHDSVLLLWEVEAGKVRRQFRGDDRPIERLALSPNGKLLANSSTSGTVRLWDTESGKEIRSVPAKISGSIYGMAFTPDSKNFALYKRDTKDIQLIDPAKGKVIRSFKGHTAEVMELVFTADGATLISGGLDNTIRAWDVASGKERHRYGDEKQAVRCLARAPDGKTLTYGTSSDAMVHIWDIRADKNLVNSWKPHRWVAVSAAYSPDSKKVAVAHNNTIAIHETATGKRLNPAPESEDRVEQVQYSADGRMLAVWRDGSSIELWDTARWRKTALLRSKTGYFFKGMAFSSNGNHLTTVERRFTDTKGNVESIVCRWNPQTDTRQKEYPHPDAWPEVISYSADGDALVRFEASPDEFFLILWDAATGQERRRIKVPRGTGRNPRLSPDGRLMACGTSKNALALWEMKTGKPVHTFDNASLDFPATAAFFSPDGRSIAAPGGQARGDDPFSIRPDVVLWETATGKERLHIALSEGYVNRIAFSPDGRLLAAAAQSESIHLWDTWTGKEVGRFTGHRERIDSLAFAPDGQTLASGGIDCTVLIWDVSGLLPPPKPEAKKLSRAELAKCWDDLAGPDAARAYRTIADLARHPDQMEDLLKDKLTAHPGMNADRLARLIADLDDDDFKARESASEELANLGRLAEGALRNTLDGKPSAEVKRRIKNLLDKLDQNGIDPEQLQLLRAVEVLERVGTPAARRLLAKLVKEAGDANVMREAQASLDRLEKVGKGVP